MRREDLSAWDALKRLGKDGYSYGTLQSQDGKFAKNVSIKEVSPARAMGQTPGIDPMALANAAALAQIHSAIEHLTERIEDLTDAVEWTNDFLAAWQEGEVLAALDTIVEVHTRYRDTGKVGTVDWARVVNLEHLLKSQHRQILKELTRVADRVRFRSFEEAKKAGRLDQHRVSDLLALESYVLRGLACHGELTLVAKAQSDELSLEQVERATKDMRTCVSDAGKVAVKITSARTRMRGRGWFEQLMTQGLLGGALRDEAVEDAARAKRREIRKVVEPWQLQALDQVGVLALLPATPSYASGPCEEFELPV